MSNNLGNFIITGRPTRYKFWKWLHNLSTAKVKKHQDIVIDVTNIILPTPSTMIIKFTISNTGKKYELVNQGRFSELYKRQSDGDAITSDDINTESIITNNFKESYEIN